MAKTLRDLFKNKPLPNHDGKTAQEVYGVRNSKDIGIQTNSIILNNSSVYVVNLIRRGISFPRDENLFEQETTGIRPLYALSSPFIYGTDIIRMTTKTNPQTETMKDSANGGGGTEGPITKQLNSAKGKLTEAAKKLGAEFPSDLNPTTYYEKLKVDDKSKIPSIISQIKKDGAGNIAGKILSQPQTPSQLVRSGAGAALSFVKKKVQGLLIGERSTTGFSTGGNQRKRGEKTGISTINYGSDTNGINIQTELGDVIDASGMSYSKTINRPQPIEVEKTPLNTSLNFTDGEDEGEFSLAAKTPNVLLRDFDNKRSVSREITRFTKIKANEKILTKRGFGEGTRTEDVINLSTVFPSDENNTILGDNVDDLNFIPLKFTLISNKRTIHFRSSIDGISETFSPSWDSAKFIGNPFSYYTYSGIERSVSFNLKVMATSANELKRNWERLSFLSSLTYPAAYQTDTSYIIPPFIKFTLGDMYKGKEGFIESLSYTVDDVAGWEIGLNSGMEKFKLPKKIDVSLTIKFVESRNNTSDYKKLYSFGPVS